jgi:hypothetical protein
VALTAINISYFRRSGFVALISSQLGPASNQCSFIFPPLRFRGVDELTAWLLWGLRILDMSGLHDV